MLNLVGRQIESYRIDALLGEGGMGAVYRAYDLNLARPVALKIMHPQFAKQPEFQQRFLQEAQAAARLGDHASIVNIYNFGLRQGLFYMVMEFVPGASLGTYIKHVREKNQVVKLSETLLILAQVAEALGYAHRRGVIHRDIKPDNVLLKPLAEPDMGGALPVRAVVTDFGLAKLLEGGVETRTGTFMGTLPYMSPEQCMGKELDGRSDLYSLGIMLYQLATGQLPFDIKSPTDAVMKHMNEIPPAPQAIRPGVPESVSSIITRSIAKDPADRYQEGSELANALQEAAVTLTDADVTRFAPPNTIVSLATQLVPAHTVAEPSQMGLDLTALPGKARILLAKKDTKPRSYTLEKDVITLGRETDNDIVLSAEGVSRYHARVKRIESGGWQIVDIGSTNGTFLEKSKLLPDLPETWEPDQVVRIGPYFLRLEQIESAAPAGMGTFKATALAQVPIGGTQVQSTTGQLSLVVQPTHVTVTPGSRVDVQVELLNQALTVNHYKVSVEGLPPEWVELDNDTVNLMPGANGSLPLTLHPPMDSSARAGEHPFRVVVHSVTDRQESASIRAVLTLLPFERFSTDMRPKELKNQGICRVLVHNEGNAEVAFTVYGRDPAEAIDFGRPPGRLRLDPGERGPADIKVRAKKRPWFGSGRRLPFEVYVGSAGGMRQSLNGQLEIRPILPGWILALFAILFLVLCVSAAGLYAFINNRNQNATQTAISLLAQQTAIFQTREAQLTRDTDTITRDASAAAETATAAAATAQAEGDDDSDGLSNSDELQLGTDPNRADTDDDGLTDGAEVNQYSTDPKNRDTDGDTLLDGEEVNEHNTSPKEKDTDNDGQTDGVEVAQGSDPLQPPTATPTASHTPTALPTASPTPTFTPTPAPIVAQVQADADRYWNPGLMLFILCAEPPCPTATPDPQLTTSSELLIKKEDCGGLLLCSDGLAAVRFGLNTLPPAIFIQSAVLKLNLVSGLTNGLSVGVSRATSEWGEGMPGRPSCDVDNELNVAVGLAPGEYSWDITELIRFQYDNISEAFGICLRLSANGQRIFSSREGPAGLRPRLEVTYLP